MNCLQSDSDEFDRSPQAVRVEAAGAGGEGRGRDGRHAGVAATAASRNRARSVLSPPPALSRENSFANTIANAVRRGQSLISPALFPGTPLPQPTPLNTPMNESSVHTTYVEEGGEESDMDRLLYMDLIAQRQADTQALHTVIYLVFAVLLCAPLLYFNYLLLSVYFTPITWALLCSVPLRRWQDAILKDLENETSVRWVCLRICVGVCRQVLYDVVADSLTGILCRVLVIWVVVSRLVGSLGWSTGMLSASALLVIGLLLLVFYKVPVPESVSVSVSVFVAIGPLHFVCTGS